MTKKKSKKDKTDPEIPSNLEIALCLYLRLNHRTVKVLTMQKFRSDMGPTNY